jgi:hypothetical protein
MLLSQRFTFWLSIVLRVQVVNQNSNSSANESFFWHTLIGLCRRGRLAFNLIINALAQVRGLRVIARTSAFAFKGQHTDIRRIAEALGVTNILEGSVRKAGTRIRVTAQLITASDGSHLW